MDDLEDGLPSLLAVCIGCDCQRSVVVRPLKRMSVPDDLVRSSSEFQRWFLLDLPEGVPSLAHAVVVMVGYCLQCWLRCTIHGIDCSTVVDVDYVIGTFYRQIQIAEAELQKTAVLLATLDYDGGYCGELESRECVDEWEPKPDSEKTEWVSLSECEYGSTGLVCSVRDFTVDSMPYAVGRDNTWELPRKDGGCLFESKDEFFIEMEESRS